MTNLTNELKARLMARYIGQKCILNAPNGIQLINEKINCIDVERAAMLTRIYHLESGMQDRWEMGDIKIKLKPLSQISDEDMLHVGALCGIVTGGTISREDDGVYLNNGGFSLWVSAKGYLSMNFNGKFYHINMSQPYQFIVWAGYDLPVFIEPNHPDNGKTMQELGLAVYE